jgi:uncharacterized protein YjiK
MRLEKTRLLITSILAVVIVIACSCKAKKLASPPHYRFADAFSAKLDDKLKEISGITYDSKNNVFLAINDEVGKLYFLGRDTREITSEYSFGGNGDYEDVALYNGIPYILRSDGTLIRFNRDSAGKGYGVEEGQIPISGPNDFETMYADPGRKALVLLCKNCNSDDEKTITAFAYYPDSIGFDSKPLYHIDADLVNKLSPFKASKLQPSGAAIHPVLHKLFIISAASRQLVIADTEGRVESVFKLSAKLFRQPEGITFKQDGTMIITNEGGMGKATFLMFPYNPDSAIAKPTGFPYDFKTPDDKMVLGDHLHEISGMAYVPAKNLILTENDEKGDIFTIDFANRQDKVGKIKFGGKGDYEDIVYTDTAVYMLISSGSIVKVNTVDSSMNTTQYDLPGEKNEFETMYLDKANHSLVMLCKQCDHEKDEIRQAYNFDLKTNTFSTEPAYTIQIAEIQKLLDDKKAEFKPSAAGINPITGKLFILASVGKLLVIASKEGKVEQVFRLDPVMYNQPEGLTFAPNGDLYISNEGGEGVATILKFTYKKK